MRGMAFTSYFHEKPEPTQVRDVLNCSMDEAKRIAEGMWTNIKAVIYHLTEVTTGVLYKSHD